MPTDITAAIAVLGGPEKARLAIGLRRPAHADGKWARDEQAICDLALSALDAPASAQNGRALLEAIALVVRDVAELPDRTSPDDWPEALLVTAEELREILERHLSVEGAK